VRTTVPYTRFPLAALAILLACSASGCRTTDEAGHAAQAPTGSPPVREQLDAAPPADAGRGAADAGRRDGEPQQPARPSGGTPLERLWRAADQLLSQGDPRDWGRDGRLGPTHLTCSFTSNEIDGLAAFNVLDSEGYQGDLKCNLLAFEMAYRAGLVVPLVGRGRGWSFPGPAIVAEQIADGRLIRTWATPLDRPDLAGVERRLGAGAALVLVGAGTAEHPGHMGVVDQVHRLELDTTGRVALVEYSGWEAGAERVAYARREWRLGRFTAIHVLELHDPAEGEPRVVPMGFGPLGASVADAARHEPDGGARDESCTRGRGLPELPVAHSVLEERSAWGRVVDVKRVSRGR
jgi:hypothetical protein